MALRPRLPCCLPSGPPASRQIRHRADTRSQDRPAPAKSRELLIPRVRHCYSYHMLSYAYAPDTDTVTVTATATATAIFAHPPRVRVRVQVGRAASFLPFRWHAAAPCKKQATPTEQLPAASRLGRRVYACTVTHDMWRTLRHAAAMHGHGGMAANGHLQSLHQACHSFARGNRCFVASPPLRSTHTHTGT